jgi:hypothetical protein
MKYLTDLAQSLEAVEPPESREALHRLLVEHDDRIIRQVAVERGSLIERDRLAERLAGALRPAVAALVEAILDERATPEQLRPLIEDLFAGGLEIALRRHGQ